MATVLQSPGFYHRRIDRSPEKPEFRTLPEHDRRLISGLRSVMEGAREKVSKLRDDVEDKERDAAKEAALRKAAETRLDQLVDMYGDPKVNKELRDRLPRAGKTDVKEKMQDVVDDLARKEAKAEERLRKDTAAVEEEEDPVGGSAARHRRSRSAESRDHRSRHARSGHSDDERGSEDSDVRSSRAHSLSPPPGRRRRRKRDSHRDHPGFAGFPGYPGYYPPFMYPYAGQPVFYPPMMPSPNPSYPTATTNMAAGQHGSSQESAQATNRNPTPYPGPFLVLPQPSMAAFPQVLQTVNPHQGDSTDVKQLVDETDQATPSAYQPAVQDSQANQATGPSRSTITSPVDGTLAAGTKDALAASIKEASLQREHKRQVALLLEELNKAKESNRVLQENLSKTETDCARLKADSRTRESEITAEASNKASAMVEEIYRAQRERDEAVMKRLRLANEERDEALLKLKRREKETDGHHKQRRGDMTMEELLSALAAGETKVNLAQNGATLLEAVRLRSQRRKDITSEEMRAVLEERDAALNKCKQAESEMMKLQRIVRARSKETNEVPALQARLLATQQERDAALARIRKLEEELQTLRVYYSLHKSLSQEVHLRDQFNTTLDSMEGQLKERDSNLSMAQRENSQFQEQIRLLNREKQQLGDDAEKAKLAQKEAEVNCQKLERLVNVLRRKISGLGSKAED